MLVDRPSLPLAAVLPVELQFLTGLQHAELRRDHPTDVDVLATRIAGLATE